MSPKSGLPVSETNNMSQLNKTIAWQRPDGGISITYPSKVDMVYYGFFTNKDQSPVDLSAAKEVASRIKRNLFRIEDIEGVLIDFTEQNQADFIEWYAARLKGTEEAPGPMFGLERVLIEKKDIPQDSENRDCWKIEGQKVEIDSVKVQAKEAAIAQEAAAYQAILDKAGLTKEEAEILVAKGRVK